MYKVSQKRQDLSILPAEPGVYKYYNKTKKIIYIGKAKSLRTRVSSYFLRDIPKGTKTSMLVKDISFVDFTIVRSELEAFLLEASLIKKHKPRYNIELKDGKSYKFIVIEEKLEKVSKQKKKIKRILTCHNPSEASGNIILGPYPYGRIVNSALRLLRRIYPYRSCSSASFNEYQKKGRPCVYGEIGVCPAPCQSNGGIAENAINIGKLKKLFVGGYNKYIKELEKDMLKFAKMEDFETALGIRDQLNKFELVSTCSILPSEYESNPNLIEDIRNHRVTKIKEMFDIKSEGLRVECYDISNIMGKWATGSMVVSKDGRLRNSEYRRFRIKYTSGITDVGMMYEILLRRVFKDWSIPELILIDGGKGQVSSVERVFSKLACNENKTKKATVTNNKMLEKWKDVKIVGIFKPHDYFVFRGKNKWVIMRPRRNNKGYLHLRGLRDEAHRFAKKYHKGLRSVLDNG